MPKGIYKHKPKSLETRRKMSEAKKRNPTNYWLGKSFPVEVRKKISEALRGKNAPNWQGGIASLNQSIRRSIYYKLWRNEIFQRDNWQCQGCGSKKELNVDHYPKSFSQLLKENNIKSIDDAIKCDALWSLENNRVLCKICHQQTGTYLKGYKTNDLLHY